MTLIAFLGFLICLALSFPIAIAIIIGALLPGWTGLSAVTDAIYVLRTMVTGVDSTTILAIPLFMFAGTIMAQGKISKKLFDVFAYFLGNIPAGMPCAAVVTCLFYGAISGSGPATAVAVGAMTIPILVNLGYDKGFCAALISVSGGLGLLIPPSIAFINYALVTGTSVTSLFAAGVLPGLLMGFLLMLYAFFYCKKHGEDRDKIHANTRQLRSMGLLTLLKESVWAILSPVIILGGIYSGLFTPTEAACVSVIYSLIISLFVYKTIKWSDLIPLVNESVRTVAPLCLLIATATSFSRILTLAQAPQVLAAAVSGAISSRVVFLLTLVAIMLVLGMFIDGSPCILILSPLFMPIAEAYGVDPIHLGVIMVTTVTIGLSTPPFGLNLFAASAMTDIPVLTLGKKSLTCIAMAIVALLLITFIPGFSLWLAY